MHSGKSSLLSYWFSVYTASCQVFYVLNCQYTEIPAKHGGSKCRSDIDSSPRCITERRKISK